jgi:hypothetical protein
LSVSAQDFSWWNDAHQWDGSTHWSSYMKLSPAYMGPNAFPIPFAEKLATKPSFEFRYSNHYNFGEKSRDVFTRVSIPVGEKASLKLQMNPIEYFQMDEQIRDERVSRDEFPEGYASGDVLLEVNTLVYAKEKKQLLFNFGLKTASGSQFRNARYTDSPAYYLNLSYHVENNLTANVTYDAGLLLGLYVWQTYMINNRQNDAVLGAMSFNLHYKKFSLSQNLRGFSGYLNNGDQPLLYSMRVSKKRNSYKLYLGQQISINDYPYNTIQLGLLVDL